MVRFILVCVIILLWTRPGLSEIHEVRMLNRGASNSMVFEPDYLKIQPGDTVVFRAVHKNHNAASIDGMIPENFTAFKGKIDEELSVVFDNPGFYGIKCVPHYVSGMIMLIKVGEVKLPDNYRNHEQPGLARRRFDNIFERVDAGE